MVLAELLLRQSGSHSTMTTWVKLLFRTRRCRFRWSSHRVCRSDRGRHELSRYLLAPIRVLFICCGLRICRGDVASCGLGYRLDCKFTGGKDLRRREANLLKRSVFGPQPLCILHRLGPLHPSMNDPGQLPLYRLFNSSLDTQDLMGRCFHRQSPLPLLNLWPSLLRLHNYTTRRRPSYSDNDKLGCGRYLRCQSIVAES